VKFRRVCEEFAMMLLSRRSLLSIAAVVDIALHARPLPVSAKMMAARHALPPRHLETILQTLVREGILKGVRGPRGGYEFAKERRKVTAGDIVRAVMQEVDEDEDVALPKSKLVDDVISPLVKQGAHAFLKELDKVTVDDMCREAEQKAVFGSKLGAIDFAI
jgi:Rrf2 family transcriptional regulator, iron-sulfur cluster assembly transcription factor